MQVSEKKFDIDKLLSEDNIESIAKSVSKGRNAAISTVVGVVVGVMGGPIAGGRSENGC